jgi:phage gpG-like protein
LVSDDIACDAKVTIGGVLEAFTRLRTGDRSKVFRKARPDIRTDVREHFQRQEGPQGRWRGLAVSTMIQRSKTKRGRKMNRRRLLGRLSSSFAITTSRDGARVIWRPRWSNTQNAGGRTGRGAVIASRQFAFVSRRFMTGLRDRFRAALVRLWMGRGI